MSDTIQTPVETLKKSTNEVAVVALADGGFIRFFLDEDDELRAQRFDAQGNPVGEIFVVAQEAGPEVTAEMLESGQIEVSFETASGAMETSLVPIEQNLIEGSDDDDDLLGTAGDDKILGLAGDDILDGAAGDDEIRGSTGDDEIRGRAGDDELRGGKGNDDVRGGAGDDVVRSGAGDDVLSGGAGDDFMMAGAGDDEIDGGAGNDEMRAGQGDDIMDGGAGDDEMRASGGDDQMSGGAGHDVMRGAAGDDRMLGGNGDDMMAGGQGADIIRGGAGNDHVVADTQDAALAGGQDSNADEASIENGDTLDLSKASEGVFVDLDVNFAGVSAPGLSQEGAVRNIGVVDGGEETFNISADDFENVIGTEFDDRIFGNAEANVLEGRGGDDVFHAFGGTDIYDGGEGTDTALFAQAIGGIDADLAAGVVLAPLTEGEDAKEEGVETEVNTLISIENLTGGIGDDVIAGSDVA
ncbi:MAG: calcium-binding protein, partial [Pseudomonadota bacterium]